MFYLLWLYYIVYVMFVNENLKMVKRFYVRKLVCLFILWIKYLKFIILLVN